MPCKLCNSLDHTLAKCNSPLCGLLVETVNALLTSSPFHIRAQVELLQNFNVTQLSVVCRSKPGLPCNGTKNDSIGYIVTHHFKETITSAIATLDQATTDAIDNDYTQILDWVPSVKELKLRSWVLFNMNIYYRIRYGINRFERTIAEFYHALQHPQVIPGPNSHLKKLSIEVSTCAELSKQECCICYDDKPPALLACGHSCCPECLVGIAKTRTKSFILCPMCRDEIATLQVTTTVEQTKLIQDLVKC